MTRIDPSHRTNVDAQAAIDAARKGQCRTAMKFLYDAAPHRQSEAACMNADSKIAQDFRLASIVVAGACTVNATPGGHRRRSSVESRAGFGRAVKKKPRRRTR